MLFIDLGGGFLYMVGTPWLLGSLIFACLLILVIMGPIEVLLPFAVTHQTGGGAGSFALALVTFVIAGLVPVVIAVLALVIFRLPKDELEHPLDSQVVH